MATSVALPVPPADGVAVIPPPSAARCAVLCPAPGGLPSGAVPGHFVRRVFWVKEHDRPEQPNGMYRNSARLRLSTLAPLLPACGARSPSERGEHVSTKLRSGTRPTLHPDLAERPGQLSGSRHPASCTPSHSICHPAGRTALTVSPEPDGTTSGRPAGTGSLTSGPIARLCRLSGPSAARM
jgi:hypothetical protein